MKLTDNFKLPWPEEEDQGAVALWMETFARQADADLGAQQDALNDFQKPPTIICKSTATETRTAGSETITLFGNTGVFANSGAAVVFNNTGVTDSFNHFPRPGWWAFGVYNYWSSLAVANAKYALILECQSYGIQPGVNFKLSRRVRPYVDSNTGSTGASVHDTVYIPPGALAQAVLKIYVEGGTRNITPAGAIGYRTWLGTGDPSQKVTF